jgi:hypothetical protein
MAIKFLIKGLLKNQFDEFIKLNEQELRVRELTNKKSISQHVKWITVNANPGFPCRVSLIDAYIGEKVLALSFNHHSVDSPYNASGAIFIREHAQDVVLGINEIPNMLRHRLLSVRSYDSDNMMIGAEVLQGKELECVIDKQFQNSEVEYIHIHNANPGCFNCSVHRI